MHAITSCVVSGCSVSLQESIGSSHFKQISLCSSVTCHCQSSYRGCLINSELKLHLIYNFYAINEGNENVCLYSSFLCICFKTAVLNHECVITSDIAKNDQNLNPKFLPSS